MTGVILGTRARLIAALDEAGDMCSRSLPLVSGVCFGTAARLVSGDLDPVSPEVGSALDVASTALRLLRLSHDAASPRA